MILLFLEVLTTKADGFVGSVGAQAKRFHPDSRLLENGSIALRTMSCQIGKVIEFVDE